MNPKTLIDETALGELFHNEDYKALSAVLENIALHDFGKTQLWKYRGMYRALPEEELIKSPNLCAALALIEALSGNMEGSNVYVAKLEDMKKGLPKRSPRYKDIHDHLCYLAVALPQRSQKNPLGALYAVERAIKNGANIPLLSITINRPSILNGGRDFTQYGRHLKPLRLSLIAMVQVLYGRKGVGIPDVAIAETLYQKDEFLEALVLLVATIPFIEQKGDICTLFAAMFIQIEIMVMSGQAPSAKPMLDELRDKILSAGATFLLPNLNAIYAWGALYDSDFEQIDKWMAEDAPSEHGEFCTIDRFQYFVKLRVYLMQRKHLALIGLAERLKPVLVYFDRRMEICELNLIVAMSFFAERELKKAFLCLDVALPIAEKYRFDRLIGDEGGKMYLMLREYAISRGENPYLMRVIEISRKTGLLYPDYLKARKDQLPDLTPSELDVLRLLNAERTNAEIAEYLNITIRTVKFHTSNILKKLSSQNRRQAVLEAKKSGII